MIGILILTYICGMGFFTLIVMWPGTFKNDVSGSCVWFVIVFWPIALFLLFIHWFWNGGKSFITYLWG